MMFFCCFFLVCFFDPYGVCICVDNHPDCNRGNTTREIFPGVTIVVLVVAFGHYTMEQFQL